MPVGRLFVDVSKDIDRMNESLRQSVAVAEATGTKVTGAGKSMLASFNDLLNPTTKYREQLDLLQRAGKSSSDVIAVLGKQMQTAAEQARNNGQAVDPLVQKYLSLNKATESGRSGFENLGKTIQDFARNPIQAAQSGITGLLEKLGPTAVGFGALAVGAVAAGVALFKFVESSAEAAEQIQNLAYATGMTVEQVQALQRVGEESGLGDLTSTIEKLNAQLGSEAGGTFVEAILRMGIAIKQGADATYYLMEMRKRYADLTREIGATAAAQQMSADLGRRLVRELGPIVMNANEDLIRSMKEVENSGAIMAKGEVDAFLEIHKSIVEHERDWDALGNRLKIAVVGLGNMLTSSDYWKALLSLRGGLLGAADVLLEDAARQASSGAAADNMGNQFIPEKSTASVDANILQQRARIIAEADAIAAGTRKELIGLTIQLNELEKQYSEEKTKQKSLNQFDEEQIRSLATQIGLLKERKQAIENSLKSQAELAKQLYEADSKLLEQMPEILSRMATMLPDVTVELSDGSEVLAEMTRRFREASDGTENLTKEAKEFGDFWESFAKDVQKDPTTQLFIQVRDEQQKNYEKMIGQVRDGAGEVFDSIVARGKGAFQSIGDWIEGAFLSRLRVLFQNFIQWLMGGFKGGLSQVLAGVIPAFGGLGGIGAAGGSAAGAGLSVAGGIGSAALAIPGLAVMGATSNNAYLKGLGYTGLGLTGMVGAATLMAGGGMGMFGSMMGSLFTNPWTAAVAGAVLGGIGLAKLAIGKSTEKAGSMEVTRDLGIGFSKDQFKQFYQSVGLSESQTWPIRKDLIVSPKFLTEVAGPIAEATGTMDTFLAKLQEVSTSWGTFDFRKAYEIGKASGDWTELNKAFEDAFEHSKKLQEEMPNWQELLAAPAAAAKTEVDLLTESLTNFRDAVQNSLTPVQSMYDIFLQTGEITEELAKQIADLGGDLSVFQGLKPLLGQVGDLQGQLSFIQSLSATIAGLAPELNPMNQLLAGTMGPELQAALEAAKLNPSKFTGLMGAISQRNAWQSANYQPFQSMTPDLQAALAQYGGTAGQLAIERYGQGFNTITSSLLSSTKAAMDKAYQDEVKGALEYLGEQQQAATDKLQELIDAVNDVKQAIVDQTDKMITNVPTSGTNGTAVIPPEELTPEEQWNQYYSQHEQWEKEQSDFMNLGPGVMAYYEEWLRQHPEPQPPNIPHAQTGGLVRVHDQEVILDPNQTRNLFREQSERSAPIQVLVQCDFRGAIISDQVQFDGEIEAAVERGFQRFGYQFFRRAFAG